MYHKIVLAGNVGRDPEMRYMPDGKAVTSFSLAVSEGFGDRKHTIWFRVSVWGKRAETANEYVTKGQRLLVEGRLKVDPATGGPRTWTRQDGTVAASYEITASDFTFLSTKAESETGFPDTQAQSGGYSNNGGASTVPVSGLEEDEIAF